MTPKAILAQARKRFHRARSMHAMAYRELVESEQAYETLAVEQQRDEDQRKAQERAAFEQTRLERVLGYVSANVGNRKCSGSIKNGLLFVTIYTNNNDLVQLEAELHGDPAWPSASAHDLIFRIPEKAFADLKDRIKEVEQAVTLEAEVSA